MVNPLLHDLSFDLEVVPASSWFRHDPNPAAASSMRGMQCLGQLEPSARWRFPVLGAGADQPNITWLESFVRLRASS